MTNDHINTAALIMNADDFRALERSRLRALVERNMALAWQLHAPDFQLITPTGSCYSRDRYLREVQAGDLKYLKWEPGPMDVHALHSAALIRYQAQLEVDSGAGRASSLVCWHTDSYELRDGLWQVVWSQATAVR